MNLVNSYEILQQIRSLQTAIEHKQTKLSKAEQIKRDLGLSQTTIFRLIQLWDDAKSNYNTVAKGTFTTGVFEGEAAQQLPQSMQLSIEKMTRNTDAMTAVRGNIGGQITKLDEYIRKLTEEINDMEDQIKDLQASLKNM